jgi:LysR family transcriptional regulator, benzoate and cis,cis-muconate-responsive activator of ben and cat genes
MELRHLRAFVTVADELHFGRAAARLGISQPPLSRQIQQLERRLGVALFLRRGRRVELTAAGRLLLGEARRTLEQADRIDRIAALAGHGEAGHLRVGVVGSALYGGVPSHLAAFGKLAPDVLLSVEAGVTPDLLDALMENRLDVAFVRPPITASLLAHSKVDEEPLVVAVSATHPLADRPAVELGDFADQPFVLFPRALGAGYWDLISGACRDAGFIPDIAHEASEIHTIIGLVAAGLGVSLPPKSVKNLRLPGVRYVPLDNPPILELHLAWVSHREDPLLNRFRRLTDR